MNATPRAAARARGPARAALRRFEHVAGYVLHAYPYSETSVIVETFTREHGRVPLVAKGAKRPHSALRGVLVQFQPLEFSWSGNGDLRNLTHVEWQGGTVVLAGNALFCGFYLNELLLKLLARDDAHERLYDRYQEALIALASGARMALVLRGFEKSLLGEIGYALNLAVDSGSGEPLDPAARYTYDPELGPCRSDGKASDAVEVSGLALQALARDDYSDPGCAQQAKQLMRQLISHHLNGKPLATRQIFSALLQV